MDKINEYVQAKATPGVSVKKIAKHFGMKRRKVQGYLKHSGKFEKVDPVAMGSNKSKSSSWKMSL